MIVEAERCGQCGQPRYICQSDDPDIGFHLRLEECNATQKRLRFEEARSKKKKEAAGIAVGTEPFTYSGAELDSFRDPFYEAKLKERAEEEALLEERRAAESST